MSNKRLDDAMELLVNYIVYDKGIAVMQENVRMFQMRHELHRDEMTRCLGFTIATHKIEMKARATKS